MFAPDQNTDPSFVFYAGSPYQDGQFDTSDGTVLPLVPTATDLPPSPRQINARVETSYYPPPPPEPGFWDKVGGGVGKVLRGVGHAAKEALPYLAAAAPAFSSSRRSYDWQDPTMLPSTQYTSSRRSSSVQRLAKPSVIQSTSRPSLQNALDRFQAPDIPVSPRRTMAQLAADNRRILNDLANAQGLPSYEQFHQDQGIRYTSQPDHPPTSYFRMPAAQSSRGFIPEDSRQIVENLSHAQTPQSYEQLFKAQAQQVPLRNDPLEEYLKEKRDQEQNMRQIRASMRTPGIDDLASNNQKPKPLPDDYFSDPKTGKIDAARIVQANKPPNDNQLEQILHRVDMELYGARTQAEKLEGQRKLQQVKESLAVSMAGPNGLKNRDGYVIIGDQAYGQNEAIYKAMQDVEYFYQHGKHMPPLKYPTISPENVNSKRHREVYPDVTNQVQKILDQIEGKIKTAPKDFFKGTKPLFEKNFPNNGKWDLQVNHGLLGQVVLRDPQTKEPLQDIEFPNKVATMDQYAFFKGKVVRAGYISNYTYGYAAAAAGLDLRFAQIVPQLKGDKLDNPADLKAIEDGYNAYLRQKK